MALTIRSVRPATSEEWDEAWEACEHSTYFHSREWAEVWQVFKNGNVRPTPELVEFNDGQRALLPLSSQRWARGLGTLTLSSPGGTYGGWISDTALGSEHAALLTRTLMSRRSLRWRLSPFDPSQRDLIPAGSTRDDTQLMDLSSGLEGIEARWCEGRGTVARNQRRALREGVRVRRADSRADWAAYDAMYRKTLDRWGDRATASYPPELFEELQRRESERVELWLAFHGDVPAAGALCFYAHRHAVYWHGAADEELFRTRPTSLLFRDIVKDACARGFRWFDFNPTGPHEGVRTFKRRLGAEAMECHVVEFTDWKLRVLERVRSSLRRLSP